MKSLVLHPALDRAIDPLAVEEYFAFGYVAEPRSIYRAVRKLPPAHTLTIRRGDRPREPHRFWDVRFSADSGISLGEACRELDRRLEDSVRLRMISEVPLGAFLSGGVDSSAVVATMARVSSGPVNTCSISFDDAAYDETRFAQQVANRYATRHRVDHVASEDFDLVDTLARVYDEPYADSSAIPTYRVCQLARRHVTVALSGDGGDESFGGYRRYQFHLAEERLRASLPLAVRRPVFGLLGRLYPKADWAPRVLRAKSTFEALARDSVEAYAQTMGFVREPLRRQLFSARFQASLGGYRAAEVFARHAARADTDDPLALVQYLDLNTYLVGDINTKVDRASMAHSLEVREPLMDHPLVEWLATLPSTLKLRGTEGKFLLKKAMEPHLPHEIMYRPKMGFAVPLARWFRGPLRERLRSAVLGDALAETGMFDQRTLRHLLDAHAIRAARLLHAAVDPSDVRCVSAQLLRGDRRGAAAAGGRMSAPAQRIPPSTGMERMRPYADLRRARPLRILTFSSLFPNAEQPAHGLFVWRRLRQLLATGEVEATVVAPVPWFPSRAPRFGRYACFARIPPTETLAGVEVHHPRHVVLPGVGMSLAPALMALGVRDCVERLHRSRGFDLIDAQYFYPEGVAAAWIARTLDLPLAITARGTDLNLISRYAAPRAMIRWAARASRLNVTVSEALAARLREIGADPATTRVIPNGVDLERFHPVDRAHARRVLGLEERNWLLSVGHLIATKGHDAVIRALAELPGWGLLVAGEGPGDRGLRALAARTGVLGRVQFRGRVSPEQMPTLYSAADVVTLASHREGMPNVLLESLACGTPVIATRVGACPDIVREPVAGRLVDGPDPSGVAAAVLDLARNPPDREAVAAYARRFAWAPSIEAQLEAFRGIARTWIA